MSDRLSVLPQYLLPKRAITQFSGLVAGGQWGAVTTGIIRRFIRKYSVNMDEALESNPASYSSFNDFFTRALKPGVRPLSNSRFISPVDGAISQFGAIERDQIFQAKGHRYSTKALVGGDAALASQFEDGSFATLYLSPRDYHRIHMPCDGRLTRMTYVPGAFFSVNPTTARGVPGLFARNERVVCVFDTHFGPLVLVLVGATIVGSMATVWHGVVNPPRSHRIRDWRYDGALDIQRGQEMGRFLLGSTVVLLWPKNTIRFNPEWQPARVIRLGEYMGD